MNKDKLEHEMKREGISKARMCEELGISRSAFYRKCRGKSQFTLEEIQAITRLLHLDSPMSIFFDEKSVLKDTEIGKGGREHVYRRTTGNCPEFI